MRLYGPDVSPLIYIRWWELTAGWAARRIQKQWRRVMQQRRPARQVLLHEPEPEHEHEHEEEHEYDDEQEEEEEEELERRRSQSC